MYCCEICGLDIGHNPVIHRINSRIDLLEKHMTEFANDQAHLDSDVQALNASLGDIETEIANLKTAQSNGQPLNFAALDAAVARAKGDGPAQPTPAEAAPAPTVAPVPVADPTPVPTVETTPAAPTPEAPAATDTTAPPATA